MKFKLSVIVFAIAISGCSSTKMSPGIDPGPIQTLNSQSLTTNFKRQGVKLEWECKWGTGITETTCIKGDIKAIEVTAYANSFGASEVMRERAFMVAETSAKAKFLHFMNEGIKSSVVIDTISKNVEKANDNIKQRISTNDVSLSDDEAAKEPGANVATRITTSETVRTLTESIRNNAEGKLQGVYVKEADVVDKQTVKVTIRWDKDSANAVQQLRRSFR